MTTTPDHEIVPADTVLKHYEPCDATTARKYVGAKRGDLMARCRCGGMTVLKKAVLPTATPSTATEPAERVEDGRPPAAAIYVCRDHGQPVTWKGKGCRRCERHRPGRDKPRPEPGVTYSPANTFDYLETR